MKYTLIVTADPEKAPPAGSPEQEQYFGAFFAFNKEIEEKGVYLAGEPLQPVEALEWASRVPVVTFDCGAIEVRACMDYSSAMDEL